MYSHPPNPGSEIEENRTKCRKRGNNGEDTASQSDSRCGFQESTVLNAQVLCLVLGHNLVPILIYVLLLIRSVVRLFRIADGVWRVSGS